MVQYVYIPIVTDTNAYCKALLQKQVPDIEGWLRSFRVEMELASS